MTRLRNNWRAVYTETCTYGSEGGSEKPCLVTGKGAWFLPYKSTSATNIAFGLVQLLRHIKAVNSRVLLIDTDSQGHASLVTTGRNDFGADNSLYTVLMADRKDASNVMLDCIVESAWDPDLHVLPASSMLEGAERELTGTAGAPYRIADPLGKIALHSAAWRLPNTYTITDKSIQQHPRTGKSKKVRKVVQREIMQTVRRGALGDAALLSSGKLYFTEHARSKVDPFHACSDYLRKVG